MYGVVLADTAHVMLSSTLTDSPAQTDTPTAPPAGSHYNPKRPRLLHTLQTKAQACWALAVMYPQCVTYESRHRSSQKCPG